MNPKSDGVTAEAGKYLAFQLGNEHYGIRILSAQEIIGLMEITAVPWTPPFIRGVINLRGKVIPIIDLRRRFGLEADEAAERCIMVVQVQTKADEVLIMGIIIDQVPDVHQIAPEAVEEPPPFCGGIDSEFVLGVAKVGKTVLMLLDGDRLLSPQECDLLKHNSITNA